MDYLRANATASGVALFVICRYVNSFPGGRTEAQLRESLQLLRTPRNSSDDAAAVLTASLAIGEGLGLIQRENASAPWIIQSDVAKVLESQPEDGWSQFRGHLLHLMSIQGLRAIQAGDAPPDLILGLTWFLQFNPLSPLPTAWGAGPEERVRALGFEAISNSPQWRAFQRWAMALGLARRSDTGSAKVLIPDASTAIADQLHHLPVTGSAKEWLGALRNRLPVLGANELLDRLPSGGPAWDQLSPGLVLGLLKLEKRQLIELARSDDASDVVALGLGPSTRQIGRISVGGA